MEISFWTWFALGLSLAILNFGIWSSRNLSGRRKEEQIRRFGVFAMFPLATPFMFPPSISEFSRLNYLPDLNESTVTTTEEHSNRSAELAHEVNLLKGEVKQLRQELAEANEFYSRFVSIAAIGFFIFTIVYPFGRNDKNVETDEPKYPLGLARDRDE